MKMRSVTYLAEDLASADLNDAVRHACQTAKRLEEAGDYEAARAEIESFWPRIGERPEVEGLEQSARAELLLRSGALSGWLGSARQIQGAQESAKDLISESATVFEQLGLTEKVAEARIDLAICYWREGALDEARITLDDALGKVGHLESEQRLRAYLNKAIIEKVSTRYENALRLHVEAAPLFQLSNNHTLRGKFHNEYATVLKNLGLAHNREDYIDQALVEYTAATFHAEEAGNTRFHALVENNVGFLFVRLARFEEAHQHLDRAVSLFKKLNDKGMIAQVGDTRARAFLEQGIFSEAEKVARGSVSVLEQGDERSLLAEALTTHGVALARLKKFSQAGVTLCRAIEVAQQGGDPDSGGIAALCIVEELSTHLPLTELLGYYRRAESLLVRSQHPGIKGRLGECARRLWALEGSAAPETSPVARRHSAQPQNDPFQQSVSETTWAGCSLEEEVRRYEANLIKQALETAGGSVTRAARMLGITHQGLAFILNGRHNNLLSVRTPVKRRRRSIIRHH